MKLWLRFVLLFVLVALFFSIYQVTLAQDANCGTIPPIGRTVTTTQVFAGRYFAGIGSGSEGDDIPQGTSFSVESYVCHDGITFVAINWDGKDLWLPDTWATFGTVWRVNTSPEVTPTPAPDATPTAQPTDEATGCPIWGKDLNASEDTVVVVTGCLNIRSAPVIAEDTLTGKKAALGSRFELVSPDQRSNRWYHIWLDAEHTQDAWISGTGQNVYSERDDSRG